MELNDIVELISKRDGISYEEAAIWVKNCQDELAEICNSEYPSLEDAEYCVADFLGLEPDYLEVLLPL